MAWREISLDQVVDDGTYQFTFSPSIAFDAIPDVTTPKVTTMIPNKLISLDSFVKDAVNKKLIVQISIKTTHGATGDWKMMPGPTLSVRTPGGQMPVVQGGPALILGAIAVLLGLGLLYLILDKVETLVTSPEVDFLIVAVGIAILAGLFIYFRKL